jgi:transposase InsO family protein
VRAAELANPATRRLDTNETHELNEKTSGTTAVGRSLGVDRGLEWVDWFNNRRLFEPIGNIPPVEFESLYHERQETPAMAVGLT